MGVAQPLQTVKHSRFWQDATRRSSSYRSKNGNERFSCVKWIATVQKQHNLQRMNTADKDGDVNEKLLESCNERAKEITREYKPEDVWNMDETGCFWKGL